MNSKLLPLIILLCVSSARAESGNLPFDIGSIDPRELPETALILTTKGDFEIEFFRERAPITVRNFVHLIDSGYYNGSNFHNFKDYFTIQAGGKSLEKNKEPKYLLPAEFSPITHKIGTIGMTSYPAKVNPERKSHASRFYITLSHRPKLDGLYTIFARVVNGIEFVSRLRDDDKIIKIKLTKAYLANRKK